MKLQSIQYNNIKNYKKNISYKGNNTYNNHSIKSNSNKPIHKSIKYIGSNGPKAIWIKLQEKVKKICLDNYDEKPVKKETQIKPTTSENKNNFPEPSFKIDLKKLKAELPEVSKINEEWVDENQALVKAVFDLEKEGTSEVLNNTLTSSKQKANVLKAIIKDKNQFIQKAEVKSIQEKQEYIDSIWKYVEHTDKELNIKGLKAIEKHGSHPDIDRLGGYLGEEDEDLIKSFVRVVAAHGLPKNTTKITTFIRRDDRELRRPDTLVEIINAAGKLGRVKDAEVLKPYMNHENKQVQQAANSAVDSITKRNVIK